jgi:ABC-2 type transport system ATP-binding protein
MDTQTRRQQVDYLLSQFGLGEARHRRVAEYSKGMRQKLALARALLHNPPVLLLDEPTSAMDPESARLVRNAITDLRSAERAIILCTHNLAEAEELADQIAIIRRGKIIAQGSPTNLKQMLLGVGEYEMHLATTLNGEVDKLLPGIEVTLRGPNWFRYRTDQPDHTNPVILRSMLDAGLPVVRLQEVPRNLEQVYLQAINTPEEVEDAD